MAYNRGHHNVYPEAQPEGWQKGRGDKPGMTLREHYAGLALQGMLTRRTGFESPEVMAADAVRYADALCEELGK